MVIGLLQSIFQTLMKNEKMHKIINAQAKIKLKLNEETAKRNF